MSKQRQSQTVADASTKYTPETVLALIWAFIVERLTKMGALIGSETAAKLANVDVRFGFPSERACASNTLTRDGETRTAPSQRWQAILANMDLGKVHATAARDTILISPVHKSWADVMVSATLGALAVLYPPTLEPVFNRKANDYSPVKSKLMRLPHPKVAGVWVAAKLQRFNEAFKAAVKDVGIELTPKELTTSPHPTATLAQLHETFLLSLADQCNPGEPFPAEMDSAARIGTLPAIPTINVERENIQGWLKKIRSTKLNPKGKPLMIFRLTDVYRPFVTGETGLRLALIPNAVAAGLLAQHPESSLFEYETETPKPKAADANVDASEAKAS